MSEPEVRGYEFGPFRLDPKEQLLLRDGQPVDLTPKMFEVLLLLVEGGGHLLEREEMMRKLWPDTVVEENNLSQCVYMLRKVLGENLELNGTGYIETVPRRGYRFAAPVRVCGNSTKKQSEAVEVPQPLQRVETDATRPAFPHWRTVLWGSVVLVALAATALLTRPLISRSRSQHPAIKSVAVLPFRLLEANAGDEYLSLGLADAIITKLGEFRGMRVRPIEEVRKYAGSDVDPIKAGRELAVGSLLEGTIQRQGDKVRINMRLLDTRNGASLWADQIDCSFEDIFATEDRVNAEVQRALLPELGQRSNDTAPATSDSLARQDYMKGRFFWSKRTGEGLTTAVDFFKQAIERDPQYAEAYTGMADAYALLGFYNYIPAAESYPKAKEAALKAVAINPNLPDPHVSLVNIATDYDWDWGAAEREFRAAIALKPDKAEAYQAHAYLQLVLGQPHAAAEEDKKALELDPLSPGINVTLAWIYYLGRDYTSSLQQCKRTLELYPDFVVPMQVSSLVHTQQKEWQLAADELLGAQKIAPANPITDLLEAQTFAAWGHQDQASEKLARFESKDPAVVPAYYVAGAYAIEGRNDDAMRWLDQAYAAHSNWLIYLRLDPRFDSLRQDPRFVQLLKKVGLSQ